MAKKNEERWYVQYNAVKEYIKEHGHLPNKNNVENRALLNWAKYIRKKINEGTLPGDKQRLFEELMATRSNEHTGGRRKKLPADDK